MRILQNLYWGIGWGLAMACFYCVFVVVLYLAQGAAPFEAHETTLGTVILIYFAGGITAGALVGLLRPLARWWPGAMLIGFLAAVLVFLGIDVAQTGIGKRRDWQAIFAVSLFLGPVCGISAWRVMREINPPDRSRRRR
jgi:hypothetical protein